MAILHKLPTKKKTIRSFRKSSVMIKIYIDTDVAYNNFDYEARTLIKAFYPKRTITMEECDAFMTVNIVCKENLLKISFYDSEDKLILEDSKEYVDIKSTLDRLLYDMLVRITGNEQPWGMLTGVRPAKLAYAALEQKKNPKEVVAYLMDNYRVSERKAVLALEVATNEQRVLEGIDYENGYSLYIGIPFCPTTCLYCSFTSYPLALYSKLVDEYLNALLKEMEYVANAFAKRKPDTVYIGGGTPTTLSPQQLDLLLTNLFAKFDLKDVKEFTVEAGRPDSITKEKLLVLKKHGIDRISINPQTMKQETLDIIGRRHTVKDVLDAFALARECGFENINMDLIVGLPNEDISDVEATMNIVKGLKPDSVTVHSLAIKRAAALNMFKDKYKELSINNTNEIMNLTYDYAKSMGLEPYYMYRQKNIAGNFENVGYARPKSEGIYNILIMEEKQTIIALGAGASTKMILKDGRIERVENVKDVKNYIERIDEMIERKRQAFTEYNVV